jgi:hypothetical protein
VIYCVPYDLDPTVRWKEGEGLTAEVDDKVLVALELDGDGDLGVLDDGEVRDGV